MAVTRPSPTVRIVNVRSGSPLTVFVQNNRSRSLWQPSLGPGIGRDRPSYAPGFDADIVLLGAPDWRYLAYHLGGDVVSEVIVAGTALG